MDNAQISGALRDGLMSAKDVEDILKLLRKPDVSVYQPLPNLADIGVQSHFVKVPTLPYYYLISIIQKLPADKDSKILLTADLKQSLLSMFHLSFIDGLALTWEL
jgi:hypothetical protein